MPYELIDHNSNSDESVARFEQMLKDESNLFFDLHTIEHLIEHYVGKGELAKAMKACEHAMQLYPFSMEMKIEKIKLLREMSKHIEALALLTEVELIQPYNLEAKFIRATLLQAQQDIEAAKVLYMELAEEYDDKASVFFQLGVIFKQGGKPKRAFLYFKKCLAQHPEDLTAMNLILECCPQKEDLESLVPFAESLIEQNPYQKYYWYFLGMIQNELYNFEASLKALDYALVIDENFGDAHFGIGHVYMNQKNYDKAFQFYKTAWTLNKNSAEINCHLGSCLEKMGQIDSAMNYYRKATQLDNLYADAWYGMGMCLLIKEKWYESIHFFRRAVKIDNKNPEYFIALAESEYRIGNIVSSLDAYKRAADLMPTFPDLWLNWSFIYYEQGETDMAIGVIMEGLDEIPDHAEMLYRLVCYLIVTGKYKEAFKYLETALLIDYELHKILFEFFPRPEVQKALSKVIDQFKNG